MLLARQRVIWRSPAVACSARHLSGTIRQTLECLQDRTWLLDKPCTKCRNVLWGDNSFKVVQDDLLHPIYGGNKARKLDALIPRIVAMGTTDVVTCGGLQSAHTAAVACACAEHGMKAHLLIRGEAPQIPTGFHLLARMFGHVTYVPRSEYADRGRMFASHLQQLQTELPEAKVHAIQEGAADAWALLGLLRLIEHLAQDHLAGMALGIVMLNLPWKVTAVMLAGDEVYYRQQQEALVQSFVSQFPGYSTCNWAELPIQWVERSLPRKFGSVLDGELQACKQVAMQTGILLDPIYSLAAWEVAEALARSSSGEEDIVLYHAGGSAGLHGLAQRYPNQC